MQTPACRASKLLVVFGLLAALALSAPAQAVPNFTVDPDNDSVWGNQWPSGVVVTVTLGAAPGQVVGTATADAWGSWDLWDVSSDLQPGMLMTVDDGTTSIQHTVKYIQVTEVDIENDAVIGVAEPWSSVQVVAVDMGTYQNMIRNVTADGSGNWIAGFASAVGSDPEDAAFDITYDSSGWAGQGEGAPVPYGSTYVQWFVPKPHFRVDPLQDEIWGRDWPPGGQVNIAVGDPVAFSTTTSAASGGIGTCGKSASTSRAAMS